jgi:hypothetical protein
MNQVIDQDLLADGHAMSLLATVPLTAQALEEAINQTDNETGYYRSEETVVGRFSWSGGFHLSMYEPLGSNLGDPFAINDDIMFVRRAENYSSGMERS